MLTQNSFRQARVDETQMPTQEVLIDDILKYSTGLLRGAANSLKRFNEEMKHPEQVIASQFSFLRDATIIFVAHGGADYPDAPFIHPVFYPKIDGIDKLAFQEDPIYLEALGRMKGIVADYFEQYERFMSGDGTYRAEATGEVVTDFFLPKEALKSIWKHATIHHMIGDLELDVEPIPAIRTRSVNLEDFFDIVKTSEAPSIKSVNAFLEHHYHPLFKESLLQQRQEFSWFSPDILPDLHERWLSGTGNSPLNELSKQVDSLDYLIKHQVYFLTQEGKMSLYEERKMLRRRIDLYKPTTDDVGLHLKLKDKLFELEQFSDPLFTAKEDLSTNLKPKVKSVFQAKTSQEFRDAWVNLEDADADQATMDYLNDYFSYIDEKHTFKVEAKSPLNIENIYMLDNAGKASMELSKIAFSLKNQELGQVLMLTGAVAQGMSSAMLFAQSAGAVALGNFVGVISAVSTVISIFSQDDSSDSMQQAFQEIFQQIILFRQELHELKQFVAQFKSELFQRLDLYFSAVFSRFLYQEEILRNGFSETGYELDQARGGIEAILKQLDDEVIYKAHAFYKGARDVNTLTQGEVEELLTSLWLRLDKASSDYQSGITACESRLKHGTVAARSEIQSMLNSPVKRGKLPGYLACYYQTSDWLSQTDLNLTFRRIINPVQWNEVAKLYLYLRQIPTARKYDPDFLELKAIEKQGTSYINFVDQLQKNLYGILNPLFNEISASINTILSQFEYPEAAKKLIQHYPVPQHLQDIMNRYPDRGADTPLRGISNEFLALEAAGLGYFIYHKEPNPPYSRIWLFRDTWDYHNVIMVACTPSNAHESVKMFKEHNFVNFHYQDGYNGHIVNLAFKAPDDIDFKKDGTWTHSYRMSSGFHGYV